MKFTAIIGCIGLAFAMVGTAAGRDASSPAVASGWSCWSQAANRYHVPADLLFAIAQTESKLHAGAVRANRNGSYDVGLMQINSVWFPALKKRFGISPVMLLKNPCLNLNVGAWILSASIQRYGLNWKGVGAYNSPTPWRRARYARAVVVQLRILDKSRSD